MAISLTNFRPLAVRNVLRGGLPEVGKIKIGEKGEWIRSRGGTEFQPPKKLDHFRITTLARGEDGNFLPDLKLHKLYGEKPKELPIRLLYNDPALSFQHSLVAYSGRVRWCFGDGVSAQRLDDRPNGDKKFHVRSCPCEHFLIDWTGDKKCKIAGRLSVVIDGADQVGGVWTLRTGSINTVNGIQNSLELIFAGAGGWLAGIPLLLTVQPRTAQLPGGKTSEIFVVGIEFRGSMEKLRDHAERKAKGDLAYGSRMKEIEKRARALTAPPGTNDSDDDDAEIVDEFYPDAARTAGNGEPEKQPVQDTREVLREAQRQLEAEDPEFGRDREDPQTTLHKPQNSAPGGQLVELWDAEGEEAHLPGAEVESFLVEQLAVIETVHQLNTFLAANDEEISRYVAEKADQLRARLTAAAAEKSRQNDTDRGGSSPIYPKAEDVPPAKHAAKPRSRKAAQAPAQEEQQPQAAEGELLPPPTKAQVNIIWPGDAKARPYTEKEFVDAYRRRREWAGPGFEKEFRSISEANSEAWASHVPAEDRDQ